MIAFTAGIASINAVGLYSQLVAAHLSGCGAMQASVETRDADEGVRIEVAQGKAFAAAGLSEYVDHYHEERNHQGKGNVLLFPRNRHLDRERRVQCRERLGGLLRYYHQEAA